MTMEKIRTSSGKQRRRRSYSMEAAGNRVDSYHVFTSQYMSYLLPALISLTTSLTRFRRGRGSKLHVQDQEKMVRYEVYMALAVSGPSDKFRWCRALKRTLLEEFYPKYDYFQSLPSTLEINIRRNIKMVMMRSSMQNIRNRLSGSTLGMRSKKKMKMVNHEDDELRQLSCSIRMLRRIVPGGDEEPTMGIRGFLSEVESYVVCLKLQVGVLRSLVGVDDGDSIINS